MTFILRSWYVLLPLIVAAVFLMDRPLVEVLFEHAIPSHLFSWVREWAHLPPSIASNFHGWVAVLDLIPLITAWAPVFVIGSFFLPEGRLRDALLLAGASVLVTYVLKNDLKWAFHRDWPFLWSADHSVWFLNPANGFHPFAEKFSAASDGIGSFPSGHTAVIFAFLVPVILIYPALRVPCLMAASSLGLILILLGVHYLGDVLAGALLGTTCALMIRELFRSQLSVNSRTPVARRHV
jgi:membrane-associated phospholipid phosphatase